MSHNHRKQGQREFTEQENRIEEVEEWSRAHRPCSVFCVDFYSAFFAQPSAVKRFKKKTGCLHSIMFLNIGSLCVWEFGQKKLHEVKNYV